MNTLWRIIADPIRGTTALWKVAIYSMVIGGVLSALTSRLTQGGGAVLLAFNLLALGLSTYTVVAAYRCAKNCGSPEFARIVRLAAIISLLMLPFFAYMLLSGRTAIATEQITGAHAGGIKCNGLLVASEFIRSGASGTFVPAALGSTVRPQFKPARPAQ